MIDRVGGVFGNLTVLEFAGRDSTNKLQWLCSCKCGGTTIVTGLNLTSGNTKSCGCLKRQSLSKYEDLSGQRFNRLVVTDKTYTDKIRRWWICVCDCGKITKAKAIDLKRGVKSSCGCYQRENSARYWRGRNVSHRSSWSRRVTSDTVCARCFTKDKLHAHHISPVSRDMNGALDPSNGIALCAECHVEYHSKYPIELVGVETLADFLCAPQWYREFMENFVRFRDKGGRQDLEKAIHTIQMLIEFEYGDKE